MYKPRYRLSRIMPVAAVATFGAVLSATSPVSAEDAAAFYKGKTVKFIVGVGVGGGFDTYARMLAPHFAKALDATIVVENQPGAGGIIALNGMTVGASDGLRFQIINGTPLLLGQLLEQKNIRYDLRTLDNLGSVSAEPWAALVRTESPIKTVADLVKPGQKIRWGGTGPTGGPGDGASITCEALRLDCKVVMGYRGSAEIALAMQRNEIDALYVTDASAFNYQKNKQARVIAVGDRKRSELMPQVPTLFEALKLTPEQQWWLDFRADLNEFGRVLVATPNVPADRLAFLRAAIKKVLTDPAVIAEAAKKGRSIAYRDGPTMQKIAEKMLSGLDAKRKAQVRQVVLTKYSQ